MLQTDLSLRRRVKRMKNQYGPDPTDFGHRCIGQTDIDYPDPDPS